MGESSFWYRPTRVVPDQRPLNGRCCCCMVMSLWPCFLAQPVDAACHYRRRAFWACVYVCVLGTPVSYAKTDKQIEMPFGGGQTRVR